MSEPLPPEVVRVIIIGDDRDYDPRRRKNANAPLFDTRDPSEITALSKALIPRPDQAPQDWMQWPALFIVALDAERRVVRRLGYLGDGWVRWEGQGDLQALAPESLAKWLGVVLPGAESATE